MNPLDITNVSRCNTLVNGSAIGDFMTRMVGSKHYFHNPRIYDRNVTKKNEMLLRVVHENLRGTTQRRDLFDATVHVTLKTINLILDKKLQSCNENNSVRLLIFNFK